MEIVLNHLTRMRGERICVAGIDPASNAHIRPTTPPWDLMTRNLLRENGGPFEIGAVVDLGSTTSDGTPPEVEDRRFSTASANYVRMLSAEEYLALLDDASEPTLEAVFGDQLQRATKWKLGVPVGSGDASLGVIRGPRWQRLGVDREYGLRDGRPTRINAAVHAEDGQAYAPVNDLRFFDDRGFVDEDVVAKANARLSTGVDSFLMVGLTRPHAAGESDGEYHWLQINGLCLVDRPLGLP